MPCATRFQTRLFTVLVGLACVGFSARVATAGPISFIYAMVQADAVPNQIHGFKLDAATGALTPLPGFPMPSGGTGSGYSPSETITAVKGRLYVINDGSDTLSVFTIKPDGSLTPLPFSPFPLGSGAWQCVAVHPSGSPVIVGSVTGVLASFVVTSTATAAAGSPYTTPAYADPWSCEISTDGNYGYAGGGGTAIAGFSINAGTGVLTTLPGSPFNTSALLPVGYAVDSSGRIFFVSSNADQVRVFTTSGGVATDVTGNPFSAGGLTEGVAGVLHPSGFYMVADRGAGVGVYRVSGDGSATTLSNVAGSPFPTGGSSTNALTLSPDAVPLLVAANGLSRNLTVFRVDPATGGLTPLALQALTTTGTFAYITGLTAAPPGGATAGDFDGDVRADVTVFRASTGGWHTLKSSGNYTSSQSVSWGLSTDVPVPADYDGDGKIDPAIFRPSTGLWAVLKSSTNYTMSFVVSWGLSTDVPLPADYDGDGKADPAVFRVSTGGWHVLTSSTNYASSVSVSWGLSTDVPVPGDYDGDGKADPTIFRPSTGLWAVLKSSTNYGSSLTLVFVTGADVTVPGDYDGDGKFDPAVFGASAGKWYILNSGTGYTSVVEVSWGLSTDVPVPGDHDGDGKFDIAVFRPSTGGWHILKSSTNRTTSTSVSWGLSTDTPILKRP